MSGTVYHRPPPPTLSFFLHRKPGEAQVAKQPQLNLLMDPNARAQRGALSIQETLLCAPGLTLSIGASGVSGGRGGRQQQQVYRRVQIVDTTEAAPTSKRTVSLDDDSSNKADAPKKPFQSSLQSSLRASLKPESAPPPAQTRTVHTNVDRSVQAPSKEPRNSKSSSNEKKVHTNATATGRDAQRDPKQKPQRTPAGLPQKQDPPPVARGSRVVESPRKVEKAESQPAPFVSSLRQATHQDARDSGAANRGGKATQADRVVHVRNGASSLASSSLQARPLSRKNSSESLSSQRSDHERKSRRGRKARDDDRSERSRTLTRKNSTESISSQRSDYDNKGQRWGRRVQQGGDGHDLNGRRSGTLSRKNSSESISSQRSDYDQGSRWGGRRVQANDGNDFSGQRFRSLQRKNSSESISSMSSQRSDYERRQQWGHKNKRDARYEYEARNSYSAGDRDPVVALVDAPNRIRRSSSDAINAPAPSGFKSSLQASTKSSQDVRFSKESAATTRVSAEPRQPFKASGASAGTAQDARFTSSDSRQTSMPSRATSANGHASPVPTKHVSPLAFKSSLTSASQEKENLQQPAKAVDEAEQKRLAAEKLQRGFEARKMTQGNTLSSLLQQKSQPISPEKQTETTRGIEAGVPAKSSVNGETMSEKDQRTKEYFSKLDKENEKREAARRAVPFQSSLQSSVASSASRTAPIKSSLLSSIAPGLSRVSQAAVNKIQYSLDQLRSLKKFAIPRPSDLPNMIIVSVIEVRPPKSGAIGNGRIISSSQRRSARGGGRAHERTGAGGRNQPPAKHGNAGASSRRDNRGGGGQRRGGYNQQPDPPLYDGPIEPIIPSENRWVGKKAASALDSTVSSIKGLLNKLTREKFAKITNELCSIEINSLNLLRSVVSTIMNKALEEATFADVYADLCKEYHSRAVKRTWNFIRPVESTSTPNTFYWTAIPENFDSFSGPFKSAQECWADTVATASTASDVAEFAALSALKFYNHEDYLVVVGEKGKDSYYYLKRKISELSEDEPVIGTFSSAESAVQEGQKQINFKRLLVLRCQDEFENSTIKSSAVKDDKQDDSVDPRQREINAMRAKRLMLGNARFIGELFKVDLLNQNAYQGCIFRLMGVELVSKDNSSDAAAEAIRFPDEDEIEAMCKMLATAGKKFDQPKTKTIMNIIILRLVELSEDTKLSSRSRFLIKDLLELRDHMWAPRRQEMQQKTLEEVRKEAYKLQQQGKNAQHDNLSQRRRKTQISSVQLAKQSSNLLVHKEHIQEIAEVDEADEAENVDDQPLTPEVGAASAPNYSSRIKNIIQEFLSIEDIEEASTCVRELPPGPFCAEFAEQTINVALEGKTGERDSAVSLLVGLYERSALDATSIQTAIVAVMEFLEDMRIDIPLIHQYSALIFGRLIAAGCFGLSWMISDALDPVVECGLASLVFAEVLSVLETETDLQSVVRMLADEEISASSVLPVASRSNNDSVDSYIRENGLEDFFLDEAEDELDPEVATKLRNTLEEYLSVKDLGEVVVCVNEFEESVPNRWQHFVHVSVLFSLDSGKQNVRNDVSSLFRELLDGEHITCDDLECALETVLLDYEDLRVDVPKIASNLCDLYSTLFQKKSLSLPWLWDACAHMASSGYAADVLIALLSDIEGRSSEDELAAWWKAQEDSSTLWSQFEIEQRLQTTGDERASRWKKALLEA